MARRVTLFGVAVFLPTSLHSANFPFLNRRSALPQKTLLLRREPRLGSPVTVLFPLAPRHLARHLAGITGNYSKCLLVPKRLRHLPCVAFSCPCSFGDA